MKYLFTFALLLCTMLSLQAQAPGKFKYQAVARNPSNLPYANTTLRIRFSMLEDNAAGVVKYSEEHTATTSPLGVFEANIGDGTVLLGSMNNVLLGEHAYFLKVELNPQPTGGNFILMGTSQLLSVPYALYSAQAGAGGNQSLDISGNQLSISNGNTVTLPTYYAGSGIHITSQTIYAQDNSETNELQYLDISGHTLSLSDGNSVDLPDDSFKLPYAGAGSDPSPLFSVTNFGGGAAIYAVTNGGGDAAIVGEDPSGGLAGVRGYSSGSYGVLGYSDSGEGVVGQSGGGTGVYASGSPALVAHANSGNAIQAQGDVEIDGYAYVQNHLTTGGGFSCSGGNESIIAYFGIGNSSGTTLYAHGNSSFDAGWFDANLYANTLQKGSGSFKIDHPLDPANKYLYHSFVESPDMMNIYNGNVITDANGQAIIQMPDYFEALNRDFRYQLTCIGTFAQVIVERKLSQNSFTIRSDKPNVEVSWQITGIRQDGHANKFRIVPEVEKEPKNKGKYLCPDCFGQPEEKEIFYDERQKAEAMRKR